MLNKCKLVYFFSALFARTKFVKSIGRYIYDQRIFPKPSSFFFGLFFSMSLSLSLAYSDSVKV